MPKIKLVCKELYENMNWELAAWGDDETYNRRTSGVSRRSKISFELQTLYVFLRHKRRTLPPRSIEGMTGIDLLLECVQKGVEMSLYGGIFPDVVVRTIAEQYINELVLWATGTSDRYSPLCVLHVVAAIASNLVPIRGTIDLQRLVWNFYNPMSASMDLWDDSDFPNLRYVPYEEFRRIAGL
jgi:hypothetical protein